MKRKRVTALLMAAAMVWTMPAEAVMATDLEFTDVSAEDDFVEDVGTEASDEPVSEGITDVEGTSEDSEAQGFSDDAAADVFGPGEETGDEGAGGEETEGEGAEVYEDSYDIPERFDVLPGWNRWISRSIGCSIWDEESQEWIEEEVPVTGMEALSLNADDPNGEPVIELTEDEDGDGWNVHALQMGHAVLKATYQLFGSQETREQEIHVWVSGDVWGTDIVSDTADHVLLPGDSMKLSAQVWRDSYDEEQGHHEGDTSQVTYKWEVAHGEYAISVKDKDGNDVTGEDIQRTEITGKEITIKANEDAGDAAAGIRMTAYDGEDEIGSSFFDLHIREGYYRLTPVEISSLEVGETITVDPILEWYESGKDPVIVEVSSYSWDWDSNALDIEDADGKLLTYETRDEDGNLLTDDDREGKAPFTITRKGDWDTNLSLTAMMEGEDGALEYAADRGYHLDGLDYNIWIEFGEGQYRNYIYSTEESVSIPLNDENIRDYEKCQVRWYAVVEGEEENDPPVHDLINEGRAAVAEDNKSITIDGTKLLTGDNPLSLEDCIHVYAEVQVGENTLSSTDWGRDWTFLEIREPWEEYDIPKDISMLPHWDEWISKGIRYSANNADFPEGFESEIPITGMEALSLNADDPNGEPVIELTEGEDGDGWNVHALQIGHAVLKATYQLFGSQETREQEIHVWVSGDVWGTNIVSDTAGHELLPGASMKLSAQVWRDSYSEEQGHHEGDTSDVKCQWQVEYGGDGIQVSAKEGREITVTAKTGVGDVDAGIRMTAYDGEDEIGSSFFDLHIREGYYRLTPVEISSLEVGETITVDPILEWYESGKEPASVEVSSYSWDWDPTNALVIEDADGKLLTDDDREGKAPFKITRKGDWDTNLSLTAMIEGEDGALEYAADRGYHLDGLDYNIWIEFGEGEYRDYIYTTEESVSIPLNDENIKDYEKCQVHWYAVVEGEEENDPPVHDLIKEGRAVVAEDNKSITINGTELLTGDNPLSLGDFIHVYAEVQVGKDVLGSTDWGSDWTLLEVREPSYDYYYPNNAFQRLPGWQIFIEKPLGCWARDERHPDGEEIRVSVNKVTVEGDEGVFELEEQEDRWVLTAEKMGTATVTIYHSKSDWDSAEVVESREFVVANDYYDVDFEAKSNNLLPGASLEIEAIPLWIQKDGEQDKEMDASDFIIKWEPSEDYSGVLTYKTDGNKIVVSADPSIKEYMECGMTAYLYKPAEDGSEDAEPLMTREFVICIDTTYFEVEAKDVYVEEAGLLKAEDFVSNVWCYQRTEDGENTKHSEMEKFLYEITNLWGDEGTEDIIKLTNNGEIQITAAPAADEEVRSAVVEIKAAKVDESNGATAETFGYAEIILCKHTYEEIVTKEPTCTDEGVKTYRCTKCEFEKEEVLPALGHKEDAGTVTKPATCVAAGELTFKCSVCGEVLRTETIRATGHTFGEYKVVKEATTEEEGLEERQCSVCGYKETRAISKKTPTPMPTQTPAPTQAPAHVHTFGEYRIVKEATVLEEGSEVRTCSVCGETEARAIDKLTPVMEMNAKANSTLKMKVKQKFKGLKVTKMAAGDSVASWKSSNTKILGVSGKANGTCRLTAKKTGKATLTVTLKSGLSQKITIKVQKPTVKTTGISVESKKVTLKKGKKLALKPELKPITSTEKIKYSSSNKKIVTVSKKGVLTAKKKGKATITIQSGRKKVKVKVTVK